MLSSTLLGCSMYPPCVQVTRAQLVVHNGLQVLCTRCGVNKVAGCRSYATRTQKMIVPVPLDLRARVKKETTP